MPDAVGLIEVEGVAAIVGAADAAAKAANVKLLGWDSIGGYTALFFSGTVSAVATALGSGEATARKLVEHVVAASITRPDPVFRGHIAFPIIESIPDVPGALGIVETRGYAVQMQVADAMVKAARVEVVNVLTVANRVVCSLYRGAVDAVEEAMQVARTILADYPHFLCSAILPQPVPDVLRAFGKRPGGGSGV